MIYVIDCSIRIVQSDKNFRVRNFRTSFCIRKKQITVCTYSYNIIHATVLNCTYVHVTCHSVSIHECVSTCAVVYVARVYTILI